MLEPSALAGQYWRAPEIRRSSTAAISEFPSQPVSVQVIKTTSPPPSAIWARVAIIHTCIHLTHIRFIHSLSSHIRHLSVHSLIVTYMTYMHKIHWNESFTFSQSISIHTFLRSLMSVYYYCFALISLLFYFFVCLFLLFFWGGGREHDLMVGDVFAQLYGDSSCAIYAEDCTLWLQGMDAVHITHVMQQALDELAEWVNM